MSRRRPSSSRSSSSSSSSTKPKTPISSSSKESSLDGPKTKSDPDFSFMFAQRYLNHKGYQGKYYFFAMYIYIYIFNISNMWVVYICKP